MNPFNINAATDGARGPGSKARAERAGTPHGRKTGWRRPFPPGLVVAACAGAILVSGLSILAAVSEWSEQKEFAAILADHDATKVTDAKIAAATMPTFGTAVGMTATWYGSNYGGRTTASGSIFNPEELTCATVDPIPFGEVIHVEANGRVIFPVVTDRMPLDPARPDRRLDLSTASFRELAPLSTGVIRVAVRRIAQ